MPEAEVLLGSDNIQLLADLGDSFAVVQKMSLAPLGLKM
jgi:hypothetical protein